MLNLAVAVPLAAIEDALAVLITGEAVHVHHLLYHATGKRIAIVPKELDSAAQMGALTRSELHRGA